MRITLSPSQQRWLALGLLGLTALVVFVLVIAPVWASVARQEERVAMLREQVAKLQALADATPQLETAARQMAANPDVQALAFGGAPGVAVAELQSTLTRIFSANGATVTSGQAAADRPGAPAGEIGVQLTVEADIASLVQALHEIAVSRPLLRIEKISVHEPDAELAAAVPVGPAPNVATKLIVDLVVSAQTRRGS